MLRMRGSDQLRPPESGNDLLFIELEESFLFGTNLVYPHMVVTGFDIFFDRFNMLVWVTSANHRVGYVIFADHFRCLFKMSRRRKLLGQLTGYRCVRPTLISSLQGV